uniref:IQ motif containing B1 n=1 Tax=Cyprinodon variegatus TaxID=28743 RepID=A0A3Q2DCH2_CYPVA
MQLENEALSTEEKISLLIDALNSEMDPLWDGRLWFHWFHWFSFLLLLLSEVLNSAALQKPSRALAGAKARLYDSGVLSHCVQVLSLGPSRLRGSWTAAARLAHLTSSSCVGAEPGSRSETFHRLFLPSVMDALLSLAGQLMSLSQVSATSSSLFRKVMDSVSWLLSAHPHLTPQGPSHPASASSNPHSSTSIVVLLLFIVSFVRSPKLRRGLGPLKKKNSERVRAACAIQAAWRSYQTRRRVKNLSRAVSALQRRYRARRRLQQEQKEAQQWEEQLRYQVCVRRQQARRRFHQKQRELLQRLPPDQVQPYLQECERRAAVVIQSFWRGFRERRRYADCLRDALRESQRQRRAARTLQRAKRRAAKAPPIAPLWIGQEGLTDSRRAELKQQLDEYIAVHRSTGLSAEEGAALHAEVQLLLQAELQKGEQRRREEQRVEALLACARTQLELLQDAPPLSDVTAKQAESFLSPSASIAARARDAHNAALQASRLPWWRNLGETPTGEETGHAHLQELEAEFGGLFIGGAATVEGGPEVEL